MGTPRLEDLPHYTWDDYQLWEGRWEIINGVAYAMSPAPSIKHQRINTKIVTQLDQLLSNCESCFGVMPVDWKIADDTVVQPDVSIVCGPIEEQYLKKPPLVIFEILSPSTAKKDKSTKFRLYQDNGVKYYCLIDPETEVAEVYVLKKKKYEHLAKGRDPIVSFDLGECDILFQLGQIWP